MGGVLNGITQAVAPIASLIPGVGTAVSAGLNLLNDATGGNSSSSSSSNPYANLSSTLGPAAAAAAAQQNANQAKNVMNQSAVQDTSATNAAIQQAQNLIAGLQSINPTTQAGYQTPVSLEQPSAYSWVNPQTMSAMIPSTQGAAPTIAPQGNAPNSYMNAVGTAAGQTAPPNPVVVNATPATTNTALGAVNTPAKAAAANNPTSETAAQNAALDAAVAKAVGQEGASGSYGTYANNIVANLAASGQFTSGELQAIQNSPYLQAVAANTGTMQNAKGGNTAGFESAGDTDLTKALTNYFGANAAASTPAATTAPVAAPKVTAPATRQTAATTTAKPVAAPTLATVAALRTRAA